MLTPLALFVVWPVASAHPVWLSLSVTLGFAAVARFLRGVTLSGAIAGAIVAFLLYTCAGPGAFVVLVSVFILAWVTTRLGYSHKERTGTAEQKEGRNALQVLANLGIATACVVSFMLTGKLLFLAAASAALAEAAADTVSSECGQAVTEKVLLVTTWEQVPPGTDGGISLPGTLAGVTAAVLITLVSAGVGLVSWRSWWICALAAVLGMFADSLLGASFERNKLLSNNAVNFLSTGVAALLAALSLVLF
jgi:uncharacterized protein (TIGR00297 family)